MSDRAPLLFPRHADSVALLMGNLNSLVLDFAARTSVGATDLSFFIIKQLPVLPPASFSEAFREALTYGDLVVPRVLELTFTSHELTGFARDLGFDGPPFPWDEDRRHRLRSELDAIFARMYGLDRSDLEWILDAQPPSASFPSLKKHELQRFGEYRTQRYVLDAFDQLQRGQDPSLA